MANVTFYGHCGFRIELGGRLVYTDPWIDASPRETQRLVPSALRPEEVRKADLVLISTDQFDHFQKSVVEEIVQRTAAQVVAPDSVLAQLQIPTRCRLNSAPGDSFDAMGVDVSVVEARNPRSESWGFVLRGGGKSVYFAGPTWEWPGMSSIDVDLSILPIGGGATMDVLSAVKSLKMIRSKFVVPMHFDTYPRIKANTRDFEARARKESKTVPVVLQPGQALNF
ncbi:MAG TPA: MBL fold metallo-hydrolase [Candidatus Norongarragalinales archaeon]|jgi:L-ascorbate metabolism protein UlaG (beta-lactamase superfamily)|nr:MBL fold metallo-hydrolase [Candidatus Norongarragalinales archaeon]